ncbi:glutathione S-transferase family protein [Aeromonas diversa]|uniref:Glutathione S-transferase n=1 Tax=Aeromonas diversa CDC 2478-85 TaxID=1268237 RepID=N9TYY6_9GAMM|nr:glutathione S-transferase family protein [Aeromonas diversa]ENY71255.1 glutathione S-transferase [Aeromonas diversa CDC 2478-85]
MFTLYIGNQNYSSWSLRPWLLLKHFAVPFCATKVALTGQGVNERHQRYSDSGLVPCLHDGELKVWDSLAIAEYLAERYPEMWPARADLRARARSISAEMHSGFTALRSQLPMNIRLRARGAEPDAALARDLERIFTIWREARAMAESGPYLFGPFSIADAMFAPVVWRLHSYHVAIPEELRPYMETMLHHPAMREWEQSALDEPERFPSDALIDRFGGPRG